MNFLVEGTASIAYNKGMNTQQATATKTKTDPMTVRAQQPMAWRLRSQRPTIRRVTRRHKARVVLLLVGSLGCVAVESMVFATGLLHTIAAQAAAVCH